MSTHHHQGTVIIGGGVIGLSLGWQLARRGEPVRLFERGAAGREASWAAAGMLAIANEVHFGEDLALLARQESMRLYPDFVAELEAFTGMSVDYRTEGALTVSLHADDTAELRFLFDYQRDKGLPVRWLSGGEAREIEPVLAGSVAAATLSPVDHQVDNRRLAVALREAFLRAGGHLHEHAAVEAVRLEEGRPPGVVVGGEAWSAERLVVAAGAWSGLLPGLQDWLRPLVRPVKGQVVALRMPGGDYLTHTVKTPEVYMAPKNDGRLVVGATVEEMGFNPDLTAGGILELLRGAWRAIPSVYELAIDEMWCGFRPGSRDNAPILGATDFPGLYVATGHFRNGIVDTPVTAKLMSELILEDRHPELLQRLSPRRFFPRG